MSTKSEFAKILRDVFSTDSQWTEWFMADVFRDDELHSIIQDGKMAATLLATPYVIDFHGQEVRCDYISCVATLPAYRGKGLMRTLMHDTLDELWHAAVPFAALIPASAPLYRIYGRMGFATVFFVDEERYTALHQFYRGDYVEMEPSFEVFQRLESQRAGAVRHDSSQFRAACDDCRLSRGFAVAVGRGDDSRAIAFVQESDGLDIHVSSMKFTPSPADAEVKVIDLLSTDPAATEAVLTAVRERVGEKSIVLEAVPGDSSARLHPRGMLRIVNVAEVLGQIARQFPKLDMCLRVTDRFIPLNTGVYRLKKGDCTKVDVLDRQPDLDVSVRVLAEILFSAPHIGDLFGFATRRPFISLMLD